MAEAEVIWQDGIVRSIRELGPVRPGLPYLIPGFVDAHIHIESSLLVPSEFARVAARHGTVACVSDPHEMANVLGIAGVRFMRDNAARTPFHFLFGVPPCVPASDFETSGAVLDAGQVETLLQEPGIGFLSEVMNVPGVLARDAMLKAKLDAARSRGFSIDGHAPGLRGSDLRDYAEAGIGTDHECTTLDEAHEKLANGMAVLIREGSAARNFDALHSLITTHTGQVMLCSDDRHPDDLAAGHIDRLASRAVAAGHDVFDVLRCACLNPIAHYRLPVGTLREGEAMDAIEVADLSGFKVRTTWLAGLPAYVDGHTLLPSVPVDPMNCFHPHPISPSDLVVPVRGALMRVIEVSDGDLFTGQSLRVPRVEAGCVVTDPERDLLLLAVINRYAEAPPALAFVHGFGLRKGAIASSVAHDSHNVIAVGADAEAVCAAVNAVMAARGGLAVVGDGTLRILPLPVGGLMSLQDGDFVAQEYAELQQWARRLGTPFRSPLMSLSFLALLVMPQLKLSDRGLFDGRAFRFVPLFADQESVA